MAGLGLSPRKALGQHFLVSERIQQRLLDAADLGPEDVVIEVGPGLGVLTRELASRVREVIAIELDEELVAALSQEFAGMDNLRVVWGDARTVDYGQLLGSEKEYKVVANLPYYAASPIVRRFLESPPKPRLMVVTVQKEVAQNMTAQPGKMRLLSVSVQFYARPRIVCYVPPRAFHPRPGVSSAVVRLDVRETPPIQVDDTDAFFRLVKAGFSSRRKQLRNSLAQGLGMPAAAAEESLALAGLDHRRRAETLSLDEWGRLYRVLSR